MSTIPAAVHDVFTYLCDCALGRSANAWRWQDPNPYRLRFLRRLAQQAALMDSITARPAPLAEEWLSNTPADQLQILASAWVKQSDTPARRRTLERVLSLGVGVSLSPFELTGRTSKKNQKRLWQPLAWLGYLTVDLYNDDPASLIVAPVPEPSTGYPVWEIKTATVLVEPPYKWADLWALEQIAELLDPGPPRRYLLTGTQKAGAMMLNYQPEAALDLLERATGKPLPAEILELYAPYADVIVQQGSLLTFTSAGQLADLRGSWSWRKRLANLLSPVHVWTPVGQAPIIANALRRKGLTVRFEPFPATAVDSRSTWQDNDRLRLLIAARVLNALTGSLDLVSPLDEQTLADLTAELPENLQRRLERLVEEKVRQILARLPDPEAIADSQPADELSAVIQRALEEHQTIQIHYQPPAPRPMITRPVIPLQLETWGNRTYLLATCLHRRAPRTFRTDRIVKAEALEGPPEQQAE